MCLKIVLYVRVSLGIEMGIRRVNWNSTWIMHMEILIFYYYDIIILVSFLTLISHVLAQITMANARFLLNTTKLNFHLVTDSRVVWKYRAKSHAGDVQP